MIYTGVDGEKVLSVKVGLLRKDWKTTQKLGKRICVVPSDKCLVRIEEAFSKSVRDLKNFYSLEVEQRYGDVKWDLSLYKDCIFHKKFKFSGTISDYARYIGKPCKSSTCEKGLSGI